MSDRSSVEPLRLGFARGTTPNKWAKRWAEARPHHRLELLPLNFSGSPVIPYGGERPGEPDVTLERVAPGDRPAGSSDATTDPQTRRAVRLYTEGVALVVAADHELAEYSVADRDTLNLVRLLDHPDHLTVWPAAEPWQDPSWMPRNACAAMALVATGAGAILLPLPLARHLGNTREHVVLPVVGEPELPGTEIWASWDIARDGEDVQQLIGVMRGRTARSSRGGGTVPDDSKSSAKSQSAAKSQGTSKSQSTSKSQGTSKPQSTSKSQKSARSQQPAKSKRGAKTSGGSKPKRNSTGKGSSKRRGSRGSR